MNWCKKQKKGIRIIEPNLDIANGYLKMAVDSIGTMNREKDKNLIFSVSAGYYCIYYSLYAIMQKLGFKCEIHSCSIKFVKLFLNEFYSKEDFDLMNRSFSLRNNFQYYVNKEFNKEDLSFLWNNAYGFYVKSREVLLRLNEIKIKEIRERFENE